MPVIGAMLWKRGTGAGAIWSIAVGACAVLVALCTLGINSDMPIYAGFGLSLAVYVGVSLMTRPLATIEMLSVGTEVNS